MAQIGAETGEFQT